ncbi:uncharacterized protein L201_006938 [Kwoniella dendrophila CBS 6074]|uniref:BRCT domain-containing protein n=1 Tax=Kwoniella dendrophila CBS 6074 TaxID=1295534 RepID=A0AAX4K482_9TREE
MGSSLFKRKRFYIYLPPFINEGDNINSFDEEDWAREVRYLKSDIMYHGGQIIDSPNYNVDYILVHQYHLEELTDGSEKSNLLINIQLKEETNEKAWELLILGIEPWTLDKLIEKYGPSNKDKKEIVLKASWVEKCIKARRILDVNYGEFGWAGLRIWADITLNEEPNTQISLNENETFNLEIREALGTSEPVDDDLNFITSSSCRTAEEMDEGNAIENQLVSLSQEVDNATIESQPESTSMGHSVQLTSENQAVPQAAVQTEANDDLLLNKDADHLHEALALSPFTPARSAKPSKVPKAAATGINHPPRRRGRPKKTHLENHLPVTTDKTAVKSVSIKKHATKEDKKLIERQK